MERHEADANDGRKEGSEMTVLFEKGLGSESPPIEEDAGGCCRWVNKWLRKYLFLWLNALGVIVGFAFAFGLRLTDISEDALMWIGLPGEIFLRLLKLTIVPLIASNVITGSASVDPASNGIAGLAALIYAFVCNFTGSAFGLLLASCTKPGVGVILGDIALKEKSPGNKVGTQDIFVDLIRNLVPDNLVRATMQKVQTTLTQTEITVENVTHTTYVKHVDYVQDVNILGLLFFCAFFGVAVGMNKEKARPIQQFFSACADVMLTVLSWFIWVSPLGICSLIIVAILEVPSLETVIIKVIIFFTVITGGVAFQELILYPGMYFVVCRRNPFPILASCGRAWVISFASSSTACAMPELFRITSVQGCDRNLTSLTVPINATLNATGCGFFICAAVLFLAQISEFPLTAGQYCVIWVLTALSSMVLPAVPSASVVAVVMILTTLSIPTFHIGLLFTVEWFLDRFRTTCNVVSTIYGVLIIDHFCKGKMKSTEGLAATV